MCDSYIRRNEAQERVIGTLLGRRVPAAARACGVRRSSRPETLPAAYRAQRRGRRRGDPQLLRRAAQRVRRPGARLSRARAASPRAAAHAAHEAASPKTSALASRLARGAHTQVALDIEYHRNMLDLHQRVSPKDVLVGWYSTGGGGITDTDALIHVRRRTRRAALPAHA